MFIDEQFGLCYMRVPTWCPLRLQVYFNGHNWLACKLRAAGIGYQMLDNAFVGIDDFDRAQSLADEFSIIVVSSLEEPTVNAKDLDKLTGSVKRDGRTYRGFNFFLAEDRSLFEVLLGGEFTLGGLRNRDLGLRLPKLSPGQVSHRIKRLRVHGVLNKAARSYKYHLTTFGTRVLATALRLRQTLVLPLLAESTGRD